jgi:response regulator NasT
LKVLLADDNQDRADAVFRDLSAAAGIERIVRVTPGMRLVDAVKAELPDVVIVDMSRPDRDSLENIRQVSAEAPRPIVLFVDKEDAGFMEEAIEAGVSSYNLLGSSVPDVKPIVQAAVAIFRRYQRLADTLEKAETRLNEREIVQRAKSQLMRDRRLTEPQAHSHLRKTAMNRGKRMVEVAAEILSSLEKKP